MRVAAHVRTRSSLRAQGGGADAASEATAEAPAAALFRFDASLCFKPASVRVEGDTVSVTQKEYMAVPMDTLVSTGRHDFYFKVIACPGASSGLGFIHDGTDTDLKKLNREWPNGVAAGLWWLRRYNCELYNETGGSHRTSGISWAEGAEVHISLDLEACEAEFFINGTRIQHKATGIRPPVRPCLCVYGNGVKVKAIRHVRDDGTTEASAGPAAAAGAAQPAAAAAAAADSWSAPGLPTDATLERIVREGVTNVLGLCVGLGHLEFPLAEAVAARIPPSDAADESGAVGGAGGGVSASVWARRARRHVGADAARATLVARREQRLRRRRSRRRGRRPAAADVVLRRLEVDQLFDIIQGNGAPGGGDGVDRLASDGHLR